MPRSRPTCRPPVVLCYHAFGDRERARDPYHLFVPLERFRRQLDILTRRGWRPLSADDFLLGIQAGRWPRRSYLVTVDDGYTSTPKAVDELRRRGIPAVLSVPPAQLGGTSTWMSDMPDEPLLDPEAVRRLADEGVEVAVHGLDHRDLPRLPADELYRQVAEARSALARVTGRLPRLFTYPRGLHDAAAREAVRAAGYAAAFATHQGRGRFALRRIDVLSIDTELTFRLKLQWWYGAARRLGPALGPLWHAARRTLRL